MTGAKPIKSSNRRKNNSQDRNNAGMRCSIEIFYGRVFCDAASDAAATRARYS